MTIPPITLPERCLFRRAESDKGHRVTSGAYDDSISQSGRNICCGIKTWHARRSKEVQVDVEIATGTFWNDRRDKKDEGCGLMNPSSLEQMVGWLVGWLAVVFVVSLLNMISLSLHLCIFDFLAESWETLRNLGVYFPTPLEIQRGKGDHELRPAR